MSLKLTFVVMALLSTGAAVAQNSGLAGLYAAQPPAGSSFVRVVNTSGTPLKIMLGSVNLPTSSSDSNAIASDYKVVDPARMPTMTVNGLPVIGEVKPAPNGFTTLVISLKGTEAAVRSVADNPEGQNALKAVLRSYNLVPNCVLTLSVANGPVVFERIGFAENRARSINPVKATLVAKCEQSESAPLSLPALSAGDKYSVFLIGDVAKPRLVGQFDLTQPYDGKP